MKKFILILICFVILVNLTFLCTPGPRPSNSRLSIKGSDTMKILMDRLAAEYMKLHPNLAIYTEGGGTGSGVKTLIEGNTDICAASRLLSAEETSLLAKRHHTVGFFTVIARDALSIYLNPENPVNDLTLKQIKQIFTGEIRNWSAVGGKDQEIAVFIRPPNSGTYFYFQEHILEGSPYLQDAETLPTTNQIVHAVEMNPAGIGYGGTAYGDSVVHSRVNGIPPTAENVRYDLYPISRYLYLLTLQKPRGLAQNFIDWILGTGGQRIVEEIGYISILPSG